MSENITWDLDEIDLAIRQARLYADPSLENAYNSNLNMSKSFMQKIRNKYAENVEDHVVIFLYGQQGGGKSSVGIEIMEEIGVYDADNIGFTNDETMDIARKRKDRTMLMRDETIDAFGQGSRRVEAGVGNLIETCRKAGLSFILCRPTYEQIDGVHFVLEILQRNNKKRITHCALRDPQTNYCVGFVLFNIKPTNDESTPELAKHKKMWSDYSARKDAFIDRMKSQQVGVVNITEKAIAVIKRLKEIDPEDKIYAKKGEKRVFIREMYPSYTVGEIESINIKMMQLIRTGWKEGQEIPKA